MKKWKERWNELLPYEKKFEVASIILVCLLIIAFACDVLNAFGVLSVTFDFRVIEYVLIAAAHGCETVVIWRKDRHVASVYMGVAVCYVLIAIWQIVRLFI